MQKVRIVTDTISDIPKELAEELGISVVPAYVQFGMKTFRDGVDITSEEFYTRLGTEKDLPKSSQPSPADFVKVYQEIFESGATSIIGIQPSCGLSGTYQSACIAKDSLPGKQIDVFDTRMVSMGQGLIAAEAGRAARMGLSQSQIIGLVQEMIRRAGFYMSLDTMDFLMRAGRMGRAKGLMASMLNIKPILRVGDGIVEPFDKVRGASKIIPRLVEICQDAAKGQRVSIAVVHANALDRATELKEQLEKKLNTSIVLSSVGPVIATNTGPGAFGVAILGLPTTN